VSRELYFAKVEDNYFAKATIKGTETVDQVLAGSVRMQQPVHDVNTVRVVASRSHMNDETRAFIGQLQAENKEVAIVSKGSALKFCLVAEGYADIYPRYAPTMEWDTAAAHAICNAVGIKVLSLETGKELVYNKENLLNPWFVCKY
ncbi:MAG: 3'(2'),5'-bisphosphate nucleotidase CysQ, partial [Flavobacteriaceae bacterium]|nr:3'(2'),5'-bisphosphate nucleotidase CysQ [Flavobacteriaceae bacterium]